MLSQKKHFLIILFVFLIGTTIAFISSPNTPSLKGIPVLFICMTASFAIHWSVFIPSYITRTEKFYDLTGTVSFLATLLIASIFTFNTDGVIYLRSIVVIVLVSMWTIRLGSFLFARILERGEDKRFREIKKSFSRFLVWWSISALWVFITSLNAIVMVINNANFYSDIYFYVGLGLWTIGFLFELFADRQKREFQSNQKNKGSFICTGLWSVSRHPNYFGEILLWIGIAIITLPTLNGFQYITLASPVFIFFLLTRVSGINILEKNSDKKWGEDPSYLTYKKNTPMLFPRFYVCKK